MNKIFTIITFVLSFTSLKTTAQELYWVGNSGNWNDEYHWSFSSGGEPANVIPDSQTIAIFDNNSFTNIGSVVLYNAFCESFLFQANYQVTFIGNSQAKWTMEKLELNSNFISEFDGKITVENFASGVCAFFTMTPVPESATCNSFDDGVAAIDPIPDGVGPFTYIWIGGPMTPSWSGVGAGTYTIIVIDQGQAGANCNLDVIVNEPGPLAVFTMNAVAPSCAGTCDGQAFPIVIGGNGGYDYLYDSGETTNLATMLCDPFNLTITDSEGCSTDTTFTFPDAPEPILITEIITHLACTGDGSGAIDLTISGGTPTYMFDWTGPGTFASNSEDISGLDPGIYDVTVTDDNGCTTSGSFEVEDAEPISIGFIVVHNDCADDLLGSIDASITGGLPPYTFSWTGPIGFTSSSEDIFGLASGAYTLMVTDDNNCIVSASSSVNSPPPIDLNMDITHLSCSGDNSGAINLTITGGIPGYIISWSGPMGFTSNNEDISSLAAGFYEATVEDNNGCIEILIGEVTEPDPLLLSETHEDLSCNGINDGSIDLSISGGTIPYDILWNGPGVFGEITEDLSNLQAGLFTVTVLDDNNCTEELTIEIIEPDPITVSAVIVDISCGGSTDGSIDITIMGGTPAYSVAWTGPGIFTSIDQDISNLEVGTYFLTVTDDNNCTQDEVYEIAEPTPILVTEMLTHVSCNGANDGEIEISISGGSSPYDITWTGPGTFVSNSEDISNLLPGIYNLEIEDQNNCIFNASYEITEPDAIVLDLAKMDITCFGLDNGSIDLTISGGSPGFIISWTGPGSFTSAAEDLSNLAPGVYQVTVNDDNNCIAVAAVTIIEPLELNLAAVLTSPLCFGDMNGEIDLTITNGVSPYDVSWTGPNLFTSSDEDIFGLEAGIYTAEVTDDNICIVSQDFELTEPDSIIIDAIVTPFPCNGANTGSIEITANGGTPNYLYSWTSDLGFTSNDEDIFNLVEDTYYLTVTDDNGCTQMGTYSISPTTLIVISSAIDSIACFNDDDASIDITVSGGTIPYSFDWTGPGGYTSSDEDIMGLSPGDYVFTVSDANMCSEMVLININEPDSLELTTVVVQPDCGFTNGSIMTSVSGGITPYDYEWVQIGIGIISTDPDISGLGGGVFELTLTDMNGCQVIESTALSNEVVSIDAVLTPPLCFGANNGSIDVTLSGGTPPYDVSWTGPVGFSSMNEDIFGLVAGDYFIIVEDDDGCITTMEINLSQPSQIFVNETINDVVCFGEDNGSIEIEAGGGTPVLLFNWNGPSGFSSPDEDIFNLIAGDYDLEITDLNDCLFNITFTVSEPDTIILDIVETPVTCPGGGDGALDITVTGGTPDYNYFWTGDGFISSMEDLTMLDGGEYLVVVTDDNNCSASQAVVLDQPEPLLIDYILTPSSCGGASDGSIELTLLGGTPGHNFNWVGPGTFISNAQNISNLALGDYMLTITDANLCVFDTTFNIAEASPISVIEDITDVLCFDANTGAIAIDISGGGPPYDVNWSGPQGFTSTDEDLINLIAGIYDLEITDNLNCVFNESYAITEEDEITVSSTVLESLCAGENLGAIDIEVTGGVPAYNVDWDGPNGFDSNLQDISNLEPGTYDLTVNDDNNCLYEESFVITEPDTIMLTSTLTHILCNGDSTGSIEIVVSGGTGTLSFDWTGPGFASNDEDIFNLVAGMYTLVVSDVNGCSIDTSFTLTHPDAIDISLELILSNCTQSDGAAIATVSGGSVLIDYQYFWTDEMNVLIGITDSLINIASGMYTLEVIDDNNCSALIDFTLNDNVFDLEEIITDVVCPGDSTGSIEITITGAVNPILIGWSGPGGFSSSDEDIENLPAGTYTLSVVDGAGCSFGDMYEVNEPSEILLGDSLVHIDCAGSLSGSIFLDPTGGNPDYTFSWTGPNSFTSDLEDISNIEAGLYTITLTDDEGCIITENYTLTEPDSIIVTATIFPILCAGDSSGVVLLDVQGGVPNYLFDWNSPGGFTSQAQNNAGLPADVYTVIVKDMNNCEVIETIVLEPQVQLEVLFDVEAISCFGETDGSISITISGGDPSYSVLWTGPGTFISIDQNIDSLSPGNYEVLIGDANGCDATFDTTIIEPDTLILSASLDSVLCFGGNTGIIDLTVEGGTPGFTYSWVGPSPFISNQEDISGLISGLYDITVLDTNLCEAIGSFEILQPDELIVSIVGTIDATCQTSTDGSISIAVTGGINPYDFSWSGPESFSSMDEDLVNIAPGIYDLVLTDNNGCVSTNSVSISFLMEVTADAGMYDEICDDSNLTLDGSSSIGASMYEWQLIGSPIVLGSDVTLEVTATFIDNIYVLWVSNGICADTDTVELIVNPLPIIDAGEDQLIFLDESAVLGGNPTAPIGSIILWQPNSTLDDSSAANPMATPPDDILYILEVIDINGCTNTDSVFIDVQPTIDTPDGFSPNGDMINDVWNIGGIGAFPAAQIQVFSRWGDELFDSIGYQKPWDGKYESDPVPVGTYYYVINLNHPLFPEAITGPLTVFR